MSAIGIGSQSQRTTLTLLFVDIVNSSHLFAHHCDEAVSALFKRFLQQACHVIEAHKGLVNQVMGDGLMAAFGADGDFEKHALLACQAAEELHGLFSNIKLRIGIHTGEVIVERNPSRNPIYRIVGETVNIAAKIEKSCPQSTTLISKKSYDLVSQQVDAKFHARYKVGGNLIASYRLLTIKHKTLTDRAEKVFRTTPFTGRKDELDELHKSINFSGDEHRKAFLISAPPGFGKTRIIYEFKSRALEELSKNRFIEFAFLPTGASQFAFFQSLYDQCIELLASDEDLTHKIDLSQPLLHMAFRQMGRDKIKEETWQKEDINVRHTMTSHVIWKILDYLGAQNTLTVIVEDIHWANHEFQIFMRQYRDKNAAGKILLVLSSRPENLPPYIKNMQIKTFILTPLSSAEQKYFLDTWLGLSATLAAIKEKIMRVCEGSPFFLHELVQSLISSSILIGGKGNFIRGVGERDFSAPTSLKSLIDTRLLSLPETERFILRCAAAIGFNFTFDLLQKISDLDSFELGKIIDDLCGRGFLEKHIQNKQIYFAHALIHDASYKSLLGEEKRHLHEKICSTYELFSKKVRIRLCAYHSFQAENYAKAFIYNFLAGNQAVKHADGSGAIYHYEHALNALKNVPQQENNHARYIAKCNLGLAFAFSMQGHHEEASKIIHFVKRDLSWLQGNNSLLRSKLNALELVDFWVRGELKKGSEFGYSIIKDIDIHKDPYNYISTVARLSGMLQDRGEFGPSNNVLLNTVDFFNPHNASNLYGVLFSPSTIFFALLSRNYGETGNFPEAKRWATRCYEMLPHSRNILSVIYGLSYSSTYLIRSGLYSEALPNLREACLRSEQIKTYLLYPFAATNYGFALFQTGEKKKGLSLLQEAVDISRHQAMHVRKSYYIQMLAHARYLNNEFNEAQQLSREAIELSTRYNEHANLAYSQYVLGLTLKVIKNDTSLALTHLLSSRSLAKELKLNPLLNLLSKESSIIAA